MATSSYTAISTTLTDATREARTSGSKSCTSSCPPVPYPSHCYDRRDRDDPTALSLLEVEGVEPEIRPVADKRAVEESVDPVIDVLAQLADRALVDPPKAPLHATGHPSTRRADTSLTHASWITATSPFSQVFPGFGRGGKWLPCLSFGMRN